MNMNHHSDDASQLTRLEPLLKAQKNAFASTPMPELNERLRRLNLLHNALLTYREQIYTAIDADFSGRSSAETEMAEILPLLDGIAYYRKRLKKFMKPQRRHASLTIAPGKAEVHYQPLGVVGIVTPWNFPFFLALSPLIGALAAGNRAMIKTSEFAPASGELLRTILASVFQEDEVAVVTGGVEVATEFTRLPFDHLVFTGSTPVGKIVMRAAAENLTPVTLELGGKSPAIIHDEFPIDEAARRLAFGKCMNAGQICVSPDYVLCPRNKVHEFSSLFIDAVEQAYPTLKENPDYTAIISERQKNRLERYLNDARAKGAQLMTAGPSNEDLRNTRKLPMTLVLGTTEEMLVMQEEIFGPILPVIPYDSIEEALDYVAARERPLALYYFDWNQKRADHILKTTHSGGVCINDSLSHVPADDIPFGGVGPSGMGHYHGEEGFRNFSKAKGVIRKGRINTAALVAPPWGNLMYRGLMWFMEKKYRPVKIK